MSLVSLKQGNVKKSEQSVKIVNIEELINLQAHRFAILLKRESNTTGVFL